MKSPLSISLSTLLIFIITTTFSQPFEGKLTYKNSYTSKLAGVTDEQFNSMLGTTQEYFIKGGRYKSVMNGSYMQMQLYVPAENRVYNKFATADTLYWMDGGLNIDEVVKFEILKNQEEILGVKCDALVVETKSGKATYYFNRKYAVDPNQYKRHTFGNWYFLMDKMKSLPLKFVIESAQFKMVSIATEASEQKLNDNLFKLPEGVPVKASAF